jgi:putative ATP-binding cassette transporter
VIRVNRNLGFFTVGYKYLPQIIPALIVARLYIEGAVEFGVVTQGAMAFSQVQGAFALIVLQFQELTTYAAVIGRLGALWEATQPGALGPTRIGPLPRAPARPSSPGATAPRATVSARPVVETSPDAHSIAYEQLTLWTPEEERPVIRDLSIELPAGQRWAITGARGPGALLVATAGLWQEGEGRIRRPGPGDVMFVPRRAYAASGRLRDILMDGIGREIPDERLRAVLEEVGLKPVLEHSDGLNAECDWATILSVGDLQALTIARLLLVNPRFAFLDNPAGDLATDFGDRLYRALADSPITFVSAGCPDALLSFHAQRLNIQDDGTWRSDST